MAVADSAGPRQRHFMIEERLIDLLQPVGRRLSWFKIKCSLQACSGLSPWGSGGGFGSPGDFDGLHGAGPRARQRRLCMFEGPLTEGATDRVCMAEGSCAMRLQPSWSRRSRILPNLTTSRNSSPKTPSSSSYDPQCRSANASPPPANHPSYIPPSSPGR